MFAFLLNVLCGFLFVPSQTYLWSFYSILSFLNLTCIILHVILDVLINDSFELSNGFGSTMYSQLIFESKLFLWFTKVDLHNGVLYPQWPL